MKIIFHSGSGKDCYTIDKPVRFSAQLPAPVHLLSLRRQAEDVRTKPCAVTKRGRCYRLLGLTNASGLYAVSRSGLAKTSAKAAAPIA